MKERKIDVMYRRFGKRTGMRCKECRHCLKVEYHGKHYYKCKMYGVSRGEGTDWKASSTACGLFNVHMDKTFMKVLKQMQHMEKPLEGQMTMGEFE